jgi:ribosomal protein L29
MIMKIAEIRKLSTTELTSQSTSLRDEIARLKSNQYMGQTTNVKLIRNKRKDLARMLTVLGEALSKEAQ